jgi:hypothetical protein
MTELSCLPPGAVAETNLFEAQMLPQQPEALNWPSRPTHPSIFSHFASKLISIAHFYKTYATVYLQSRDSSVFFTILSYVG